MDVNAPIALIGASYRTPDAAVDDFTSVWAARRDGDFHHTAVAVLTRDPDGRLHVERHNSTAKHLEWGGALLGAALVVLAPAAGVEILATVGLSGAGAMVGHFRHHADPRDLAAIAGVLDSGSSALVVVIVNRDGRWATPLLSRADGRASVDMPWGDLEEELSVDFAHPTFGRTLVAV
ncbi:MAG TPA: hypothetical protein VFG13_17315 [Blastococcus sp.]|nr:hypothetical protein [Blastococcus sp.]